jgi:endonuclease G, mitochondrial
MKTIWSGWRVFLLVGILSLLLGCTAVLDTVEQAIRQPGQNSPHLFLGQPSNATRFNAKDYLIVRPQYALSYNRDKGIPNWASWQLNQSWLGNLPRLPFIADSSLPEGWYRVQTTDYTGSGFDRGHLVPAADRNRTQADSTAVFLMTNIFPQAPDNNQGPWEQLESDCRDLAEQGKELYIMTGGLGEGGTGSRGKATTIGKGKISVPAAFWKIVIVLDRPGLPLDSITADTPVIAVIMPNQQGIKTANWQTYQTSIDEIEKQTGYDFLPNLAEPIQAALEAKRGA